MGDDKNAAGRCLGGAYVKRLRMLGTRHSARAIVAQLSVQTAAATRAAPDGCNMIV